MMFFEDDFQLDFNKQDARTRYDPLLDGGKTHSNAPAFTRANQPRTNQDLDGVVTDRYHAAEDQQQQYEAMARQDAAIRMAAQRKVTFQPEQLAFNMNVDNTGLFAGEQPAPLTQIVGSVNKAGRKSSASGRKASGKRSVSAKKRPATTSGKQTYDQKQTAKYKKSIDQLKKKIGAKDKPKPVDSSGWNDSTTTGKYFDVNVDVREKRAALAKQNQAGQRVSDQAAKIIKNSGNAISVKTAAEEPGKFNVEFQNRGGVTSSAFQIYQNIDQLVSDTQKPNYTLLNYKVKNTPSVQMPQRRLSPAIVERKAKPGLIDIAAPCESLDTDEIESVEDPTGGVSGPRAGRKTSHLKELHLQNKREAHKTVEKMIANQQSEHKINSMIGEALTHKEGLIEELEKELALERTRREQMNQRFEKQMKEFSEEQRAVESIKKAAKEMESGRRDKSLEAKRLVKDEYDMVPTRLKPVSATANGITFSTRMEPRKPVPSEARLPSRKKLGTTYDPSRVKSSIPGASARGAGPSQSHHGPHRSKRGQENAASYIEELKKVETERAVQIEQEQQATQEILQRMRDNPNSELFAMHNEVSLLNRKIEPILKRVELASERVKQTQNHGSLSSQPGPVGMLSKMAGRLITFYADDLASLLFEDILSETVQDLQQIEKATKKEYAEKHTEAAMKDILSVLAEYQAEEQKVDMRWSNKAVQREIQELKLGEIARPPKAIEIDLNHDYCELSVQEPEALAAKIDTTYVADSSSPSKTGIEPLDASRAVNVNHSYQNPFERSNDFARALTSQTKTGKQIKIGGAVDPEKAGLIKRKWRIEIDQGVRLSIEEGRESWNKWLKEHNNTSNKKVWEVYDHLAADLTREVLNEMMGTIDKDLDSYCEKVIVDEFQLE